MKREFNKNRDKDRRKKNGSLSTQHRDDNISKRNPLISDQCNKNIEYDFYGVCNQIEMNNFFT